VADDFVAEIQRQYEADNAALDARMEAHHRKTYRMIRRMLLCVVAIQLVSLVINLWAKDWHLAGVGAGCVGVVLGSLLALRTRLKS
jgi:hypothetical protein